MITRCEIFTTPTCIKCQRLKAYLATLNNKFDKKEIDASTPEGLEKARAMKVISVPTIVFYDDSGKVAGIAHDEDEIETIVGG
jgi:glutaredoxin